MKRAKHIAASVHQRRLPSLRRMRSVIGRASRRSGRSAFASASRSSRSSSSTKRSTPGDAHGHDALVELAPAGADADELGAAVARVLLALDLAALDQASTARLTAGRERPSSSESALSDSGSSASVSSSGTSAWVKEMPAFSISAKNSRLGGDEQVLHERGEVAGELPRLVGSVLASSKQMLARMQVLHASIDLPTALQAMCGLPRRIAPREEGHAVRRPGIASRRCAAELMLRHKGVDYRRIDLVTAAQQALLRALGFPRDTVPALRLDGARVQGTPRDRASRSTRSGPSRRCSRATRSGARAVEEAERLGRRGAPAGAAPAGLERAGARPLDDRQLPRGRQLGDPGADRGAPRRRSSAPRRAPNHADRRGHSRRTSRPARACWTTWTG